MMARPRISRNEWKAAELGAFEVGNVALLSCPGEETAQRRRACEAAAVRLGDALAQLRQQAVSLGLSESSAASLREPRDAVREVAHRLHYHMRRAAHLGDAVAGAADQETSGGGAGPSDEERLRTLDDLRERVAARGLAVDRINLGQ